MRFEELKTEGEILDLLRFHNAHSESVTLDCETTSVDPKKAKLLDVQISGRDADHVVIFNGDYASLLLELAPHVVLVGHSYKYDAHVLFRHGVDLLSRTWRDTLLLGHLQDENRESYSLDSFVQEIWNDNFKEEFWAKHKAYQDAPRVEQIEYACKDIFYTSRLYARTLDHLRRAEIPVSLGEHVHRLQAVLVKTEIQGIQIDLPYLTERGLRLKVEIERLRPEMRALALPYCLLWEMEEYGKELAKRKTERGKQGVVRPVFSFDSGRQLQSLLYTHLGLPPQRNEKTKAISVDEASLERLKESHALIPKLLEYRGLHKTYTAFIEGTESRIDKGRIYPEFRVNGTKTGRISHSNPNLGQLPKAGGIRRIYRPDDGYVFISADYSQLEVCLEANFTGDPQLARIFKEGLSKHDITAQELKIDRHAAKTLNFAMGYHCSHFKVAKLLGVPEQEGKKIWEDYWKLYSGPKRLKAETDRIVDNGGVLSTIFGRRRRFEQRKRNPWDADYRQAYNFLIQGAGADITSRAFYLVSEELEKRQWGRGLFTVHDECLIAAKTEIWKEAEHLLLSTMVLVGEESGLKIPLSAQSSGAMAEGWED